MSAIVVSGPQAGPVGRHDRQALAELLDQELQHRLDRPIVEPEAQSQGEEVLAAGGVLARKLQVPHGLFVHPRHRHGDDAVGRKLAAGQRVGGIAGLGQVGLGELVFIDHEDAARLHVAEVDLQGRRVHGDQHVRRIARRMDLVIGEAELKTAHAAQRTGRGADLRRVVGLGADGQSGHRSDVGELAADDLHAVARVAGKADRGGMHLDEFLSSCGRAPSPGAISWVAAGEGSAAVLADSVADMVSSHR